MAFSVQPGSGFKRARFAAAIGAALGIAFCLIWALGLDRGLRGFGRASPSHSAAAVSPAPSPASASTSSGSPASGSPIRTVSQDIPAEGRALLDTLAGSESNYPDRNPYTVVFGGGTAPDLSDHPRQHVLIEHGPNGGKTTTAAGRYQYLQGSWDEAKEALGLPDFSPESQDKAAFWEAQRAYKTNTGRDLVADIRAAGSDPKKLTKIGRGLSSWWTSLPSGIEPNDQTKSFGERFADNLTYYGIATPTAAADADPN